MVWQPAWMDVISQYPNILVSHYSKHFSHVHLSEPLLQEAFFMS